MPSEKTVAILFRPQYVDDPGKSISIPADAQHLSPVLGDEQA